jgi:hypothetical protein
LRSLGWDRSAAAGCFSRAATGAAGAELHAAIELEPIHVEIDFNGCGALEKLFVDDVFETVHIKLFIQLIRLIQSHGQTGAASPTFVQKNPDRLYLFVFEIFGNLFGSCRCNF